MRWARATTLLAVLLAGSLACGFALFVAETRRAPGPLPVCDGIVALTGGADRVETALRLLQEGQAGKLLISGVHGASLAELARRSGIDPAPLAARITLGHFATSTEGNGEEAAEWAHSQGLHTLIVVTASYHMPRAMLELHRAMPDVTLYPAPVQTAPLRPRLLASEFVKLIGAFLGASRLVRTPVDNSVNG